MTPNQPSEPCIYPTGLSRKAAAIGGLLLFLMGTSAGPTLLAAEPPLTNSLAGSVEAAQDSKPELWVDGIGNGFRPSAESFTFSVGASEGVQALGGLQHHDLAVASLCYGHMIRSVVGQDEWYRGNWEFRAELFTGAQFSPDTTWLVGLTPHLRYDFATGTRIIPFVDLGTGVSSTGIRAPDLSGGFEFNLQAAIGAQWFLRDDVALTADARFLHMSCAGLSSPNRGLNGILGTVGLSWFF